MSPKNPYTELQDELRNGDFQPTPADVRRETMLDLADALRYPGRVDLAAVVMRHVTPALAARDKRIAELESEIAGLRAQLAPVTPEARHAAIEAVLALIIAKHQPDLAGHCGTGDGPAIRDDATDYTDAVLQALAGGA